MDINKEALRLHKDLKGKIDMRSKLPVTKENIALLYTPGVAAPCLEIKESREKVYDYTGKGNTIAIVTDGTAVLGLGDIGPEAALPVMEGKSILFKEFGGVDAVPICLSTKNVDEIVDIVAAMAPGFGGINLEDISAPRCFEIEQKLIDRLNIPVFHDDQHGTAVVVYAGLINALKLAGKRLADSKIVINGAGAAGTAIARFLLKNDAGEIVLCDRAGAIYRGRKEHMNEAKASIAEISNHAREKGALRDIMRGADVFIGVSAPNILTQDMVRSMSREPILFTLANPEPEIAPEAAKAAGVKILATGRSDYKNQVNNLLAFPGLFKGALAGRAKKITFIMKKRAAEAIAALIDESELDYDYFIPSALNKKIADVVAAAVIKEIKY